ncbi:MAG TPA: ester cyclase [Candidatus Dormibacteraeota bacterium]|nr:ester cyclase [Candidatus Dormibacteraeota bacterium]
MGDAKTVIERLLELWVARDKAGTVALYDDAAEISAPGGLRLSGKDGWSELYDMWMGAFPDNRITGAVIFGAGDQALEEAVFTGTQTGTMHTPTGDVPPTGRRVDIPYTIVYRLRDGRVSSMHLYFDQVELMTQLGLMPAPAAAG